MKKGNRKLLCAALVLLGAFVAWTLLVRFVDVEAIGPQGSSVGFAALNQFVHGATGVNMTLYVITDWLGLVPIFTALGFAVIGLYQWIARRSILRVDHSILALGVFYLAVMAAYVFFEYVVVNYRPVLIEGVLEASYPSSTTLLTLCVMPTAAIWLSGRMKKGVFRLALDLVIWGFTAFMLVARLISGVHWVTDIVGGILLGAGLVMAYAYAFFLVNSSKL